MTIQVIHAPTKVPHSLSDIKIFLGGSIEMDLAERWQDSLIDKLNLLYGQIPSIHLTILNPRRPDWDSSWDPVSTNHQFCEQVNWELDSLEASDIKLFVIDGKTKSPITLLEIGKYCVPRSNCLVLCPIEFWRSGNVDIVCERSGIAVHRSWETFNVALYNLIDNINKGIPTWD